MLAAIESEKLILSTTSNNYGQHGLLTNGLERKQEVEGNEAERTWQD